MMVLYSFISFVLLININFSSSADTCRKKGNFPAPPQDTCGSKQTIFNEGLCLCCYKDTKDIPTIGIGFNLKRTDASQAMSKYNLKLADVLDDCEKKTTKNCLTEAQAEEMFNSKNYPEAEKCVDAYVPNLPAVKRAAVIDVAFAGCATLNKFVNMKAALVKKDWVTAAAELKNSKWCKDVKERRCNADANCIKG